MAAALEDSCSLRRDKARATVGETQVSHKRYFPILRPGGSHISKGPPGPVCSKAHVLILEAAPRQQWLLCLGSSGGGEEFTGSTSCGQWASHPAPVPWPSPSWPHKR